MSERKTPRNFLTSIAAAALTAIVGSVSISCAAAQTPITLALPAPSLLFAPAYLALETGLFREKGLDVKIIYAAGPAVIPAVMSKSAQVAMISGGIQLAAAVRDQKVIAIGNTQDRFTTDVVMRKEKAEALGIAITADPITRIKAMKGMTIGIDAINGLPHSFVKYLAKKAGMDPERDFTFTPLQPPALVSALRQGTIDAFAFSPPFSLLGVQNGGVMWISGAAGEFKELLPFAYNVIVVRPDYCADNKAVCQGVVDAIKSAIVMMKSKPDESIAGLGKAFANMDPALLKQAFPIFASAAQANLRIDAQMMENVEKFDVISGIVAADAKIPAQSELFTGEFTK